MTIHLRSTQSPRKTLSQEAARLAWKAVQEIDDLSKAPAIEAHAKAKAKPATGRAARRDRLLSVMRKTNLPSLGATITKDGRSAFWSSITTMQQSSLYKGLGVAAHYATIAPNGTIQTEVGLEAMIDVHVLKRLALRAPCRTLDDFIQALKPVIAWSSCVNQANISGRYVVATDLGIFICARAPLPLANDEQSGEAPRVITFYGRDELSKSQVQIHADLTAAGAMKRPAYPSATRASKRQIALAVMMHRMEAQLRA